MEQKQKTIGVLTSGGDAPGMNAAVRAVVRAAQSKGVRVIGIERGYNGLINGEMRELTPKSVCNIIHYGGTILYTARCLEFKEEAGVVKATQTCIDNGIDGIVVIGGDGSFRGAADLSRHGIPCVGIPGTIDNDITMSDYTIGYDSAMNTVLQMVDKLRDTSQSHDRCSVIEVMGRKAGYIALNAGIACGAVCIVTAEMPLSTEEIVARVQKAHRNGKENFIVMVSEGIGKTTDIAKAIEAETGIETRATILGHVQRGGNPTLRDRVAASVLGYHAVELLSKGIGNRVLGFDREQVVDYDIQEALSMTKEFPMELYQIADALSF